MKQIKNYSDYYIILESLFNTHNSLFQENTKQIDKRPDRRYIGKSILEIFRLFQLGIYPNTKILMELIQSALNIRSFDQIALVYDMGSNKNLGDNQDSSMGASKSTKGIYSNILDDSNKKKLIQLLQKFDSKIHFDVLCSCVKSMNIETAINVAKAINTPLIWTLLVNVILKIFGTNSEFLDRVIDTRIEYIQEHKLSMKNKETNLPASSDGYKIDKNFHYNIIYKILMSPNSIDAKSKSQGMIETTNSSQNDNFETEKSVNNNRNKNIEQPSSHESAILYALKVHNKLSPFIAKPSSHAINHLVTSLINLSKSNGENSKFYLDKAFALFKDTKLRWNIAESLQETSYMYSGLAKGLVLRNNLEGLVNLTEEMEQSGIRIGTVYYSILIDGLLSSNKQKGYTKVQRNLKKNKDLLEKSRYNRTRSEYLRPHSKMITASLNLFSEMGKRGLPRTSHIYTRLMWSLSRWNMPSAVHKLFNSLKKEEEYWAKKRKSAIKEFINSNNTTESECSQENNTISESKLLNKLLYSKQDKAARQQTRDLKTSIDVSVSLRVYTILMYSYRRVQDYNNVIKIWKQALAFYIANIQQSILPNIQKQNSLSTELSKETGNLNEKKKLDLAYDAKLWEHMVNMTIKSCLYLGKPKIGLNIFVQYQNLVSEINKSIAGISSIGSNNVPNLKIQSAVVWLLLENYNFSSALAIIRSASPLLYDSITKSLFWNTNLQQVSIDSKIKQRGIHSNESKNVLINNSEESNLNNNLSSLQNLLNDEDFINQVSKNHASFTHLVRYFIWKGELEKSANLILILFHAKRPPNSSVWRLLITKLSNQTFDQIKNLFSRITESSNDLLQVQKRISKKAQDERIYSPREPGSNSVLYSETSSLEYLVKVYECWRINEVEECYNEENLESGSKTIQDVGLKLNNEIEEIEKSLLKVFGFHQNFNLEFDKLDDDTTKPKTTLDVSDIIENHKNYETPGFGYYILPISVLTNVARTYFVFGDINSSLIVYLLALKSKILSLLHNKQNDLENINYSNPNTKRRKVHRYEDKSGKRTSNRVLRNEKVTSDGNLSFVGESGVENAKNTLNSLDDLIVYYMDRATRSRDEMCVEQGEGDDNVQQIDEALEGQLYRQVLEWLEAK
ncbi:hypothetical protein BB558_003340 [Smittium angustum]|uniref:Uncharacterized protein n=1 Tax=Smittium angustum TaxID=133377 RepID=A0A2U1J6D3_SMIAN|nr:hypothetical protein BB558_003340 [Smittium angustum]